MSVKKRVVNGITIIEMKPGRLVICDLCSKDWTFRTESGGFLFLSKVVCPDCAPEFEQDVIREDETEFIRAYCPKGKSFADWVRQDLR